MDESPTQQNLPDLPAPHGVPEVSPSLPADLAPPAYADEEFSIDWGRYIAALQRYKWMILGLTVLGTVGAVFGSRFINPDYAASAKIWIEPDPGRSGPIRAPELLSDWAWTELISTSVVLDSAALKAKLYLQTTPEDEPLFETFELAEDFTAGRYSLDITPDGRQYLLRDEDATIESGTPGDSIGSTAGFIWAPPAESLGRNRSVTFTVTRPRAVAAAIRGGLNPRLTGDRNFLDLSFTGKDPKLAAKTLNAVVDQFISVAAEQKRRKLSAQLEALEEQVDLAATDLRNKENRLESFRVRTITLPNEGVPVAAGLQSTQPTVMSNFFQQRLALDALQQDRRALEAALARASSSSVTVDAFQSIPKVQSSPELSAALRDLAAEEAQLRTDLFVYTEDHRLIQDRRERIRILRSETIPQLGQSLVSEIGVQESALQEQIGTASQELQQIPRRTIQEQRLTREKLSAEVLFQQLQNNFEQTRFALASTIPDVRLLDPAVPPRGPTSNTAPQIWFLGFLGSLGGGILLALLLDRLDRRVRYPDQVTRELGLTILGAIPAIRKVKAGKRDTEEASQVVEAFRTIRLNLAHSYGAAGPVLLTVSSPGPGDGKSLVSANLALSFAEAGYKTLLLDGDIRRGELHRMFGLNRQPGLLDFLTQEATLDEVLKPTTHRGLTILPCGTRRHRGPEMLGSPPMTDLMAEVKSRFNAIVVDSPPLGAGIDPFVLGTATGHMLLVLRSGETDRQMAEAKLRLMDRLPIRMLGAVLNDIETRSGTYRYYSYVYGYTADDEVVGQLPVGHGNGRDEGMDHDS
ncbi:MAG: polysaccharide biosynthesis tyrosine autokinase [Gemmatimonadales bacterium]|nr:polysaccharide biosynthesis tyrosine autokinase [Gemmatimonadales bacterium]